MDTRQYFRARGVARSRLSPKLLSSINSVVLLVVVVVFVFVFVFVFVVDGVVGARTRKKRTLRDTEKFSMPTPFSVSRYVREFRERTNEYCHQHRLAGYISRGGSLCIPEGASVFASLLIIPPCSRHSSCFIRMLPIVYRKNKLILSHSHSVVSVTKFFHFSADYTYIFNIILFSRFYIRYACFVLVSFSVALSIHYDCCVRNI